MAWSLSSSKHNFITNVQIFVIFGGFPAFLSTDAPDSLSFSLPFFL